jgi:hypothetical protein
MKKIIILITVVSGLNLAGRENVPNSTGTSSGMGMRVMANCLPPKASKELWANNVRTIIFNGGDMWWDRTGNGNAYYYVPAVQNRVAGASSCFGGSIWLGGLDAGGQLKVAAMTYRQKGIDFWPGPLDTTNAAADPAVCAKYDEIYTITRAEVDNFFGNFETGAIPTSNILAWPGNGDISKNQGRRLAPFVDRNGDGFYDPTSGDYPAYDVENRAQKDNLGFCKTKLFGDFTLFWIFNDNGGIHTETQGFPIGVEVRAQAFAFKTNDEINNMTFYSYEIYNRSSFQLNKTYFTVWNDPDLGYYLDDYVGCDVKRGLGYIYNADPFDETVSGAPGYQDYPPALGCDFFKGPLADPDDKINNDQDSLTDEPGETIQMSRFTYYNNNIGAFPPQTTNPDYSIHYYNYMTGLWKDGSAFTFGGNAYGGTSPATFVYDGDPVSGTGWTERGSGNPPGDRRFLQSAGPFTLKPGAVNDITFGMPWAQSPSKGGNIQSLQLLYSADDKAQALFDNCFKLLDGPEAPNMTIQELDNALIFYLTNEKGKSNNYKQFNNDYAEVDISIISDPTSTIQALSHPDKTYRFEGYIVYQVKNDAVTSTDLDDPTKAKVVFQCDIANGHGRLVNYEPDNTLGADVPKVKVDGADKGIATTFSITEDAFSTSENRKLVNNKQYYFFAVAYAFNEYLTYEPDVAPSVNASSNSRGQKKPYLEGRRFKRASGIPHSAEVEKGGTVANSAYGFGPKITRIEGQGNGGNRITLTQASEEAILVPPFFKSEITYENAQGPLNIKVVDPLNVKNSTYSFKFINHRVKNTRPEKGQNAMIPATTNTSAPFTYTYTGTIGTLNVDKTSWELKDLSDGGKTYYATEIKGATVGDTLYQAIKIGNEFYFQDLGLSVNVTQTADPGEMVNRFTNYTGLSDTADYQGPAAGAFIGATINYVGGASNWLGSVPDIDSPTPFNWILSGTNKTAGAEDAYYRKTKDVVQAFYDPQKQFAKILGGTWAPYPLCASYYSLAVNASGLVSRNFGGPGFNGQIWAEDPLIAKTYSLGQVTSSSPSEGNTDLRKLSSALIVFTRDKSKWTRCVVYEMQEKSELSQGNALFFSPRKHKSVNKNGDTSKVSGVSANIDDPNFISETGMGWFPGYAICLETGERLNMAFGEDSYQRVNNGDDMIWNPTSNLNSPFPYAFGGKHFVYVFGGNSINTQFYLSPSGGYAWEPALNGKYAGAGRYDYGKRMIDVYNNFFTKTVFANQVNGYSLGPFNAIERDIMWVSIPMPAQGYAFNMPDQMPSDIRIQINVSKPYRYGWAGIASLTNQSYLSLNKLVSVNSPSLLMTPDTSLSPRNNNFPMYTFNTNDIATLYDQGDVSQNALDRIRVVPNPYYGSSSYELNRTDNKVRITNLPNKCTIKIFTMNGTLVRTIKRDVTDQEDIYLGTAVGAGDDIKRSKRIPFVEWDMKNQNNISVASGLYIIHIDAPNIGEKIVKWFGIMRPLDVQNY